MDKIELGKLPDEENIDKIEFKDLSDEETIGGYVKELIDTINVDSENIRLVSSDNGNRIGYYLNVNKDNLNIELVVRYNKELSSIDSLMCYAFSKESGLKYDYAVRVIPGSDTVEHIIVKTNGNNKEDKKVFKYKIDKGLSVTWLRDVLAQAKRFVKRPSFVYHEISSTSDGALKKFVDNIGIELGEATLDSSIGGCAYTYDNDPYKCLTLYDDIRLTIGKENESYSFWCDNEYKDNGEPIKCTAVLEKTVGNKTIYLTMNLVRGNVLGFILEVNVDKSEHDKMLYEEYNSTFTNLLRASADFVKDPLSVLTRFQNGSYTTKALNGVTPLQPIITLPTGNSKETGNKKF